MSLNAHPVPECLIRCDWNEVKKKNLVEKKKIGREKENERKKLVEKNLRNLILRQYQSADLKSF